MVLPDTIIKISLTVLLVLAGMMWLETKNKTFSSILERIMNIIKKIFEGV